jgi:hypothetical protein
VSPHCVSDCPTLQEHLVHETFLEELMFWTVKYEFPLKVVCLLLNMLPDPDYKVSIFPFPIILSKDLIRLGHCISVLIGCESNSPFFVLRKSREEGSEKNSCVQTHVGRLIVGTSLNLAWPTICLSVNALTTFSF